ncbi:hypothetical protein M0805_008712 [Coniferiporia weirii]|nr:hypothetical protein M0805_008712 [Coniferiporia weirii]
MTSLPHSAASRSTSPSHRQSRVADAVQVAPYLTHVVRHHGQITLIPPENSGRIRKAKKSRPALRSNRSSGDAGPSFGVAVSSRTGSNVSHRNSPEPGLRTSSRPGSSSRVELRNAVLPTSETHTRSTEGSTVLELLIPDFPPPSFEEAVASRPSPNAPSINSLNTSRAVAERAISPAQDGIQVLSFNQNSGVSTTGGGSPPQPEEVEEAYSESSHSSFEFAEGRNGHSLWEDDRKAGFSLEERVQRELERRYLTESLPSASTIQPPEGGASSSIQSPDATDAYTQNSRRPVELTFSTPEVAVADTTSDIYRDGGSSECAPIRDLQSNVLHSDAALTLPEAFVTRPSSSDELLYSEHSTKASKAGREKAKETGHGLSVSLSVTGTVSRLRDALNAPLRATRASGGEPQGSGSSSSLPSVPLHKSHLTKHSLCDSSQTIDSHLSHRTASNNVPSTDIDTNDSCLGLSSKQSTFAPAALQSPPAVPCPNTHRLDPARSPTEYPFPSDASTSRNDIPKLPLIPPRPVLSPAQGSPSASGSSVRDRVHRYESLLKRPLPPPPPPRAYIRRPPPPVPGRASDSLPEPQGLDSIPPSTPTACASTDVPSRRRAPPPPPPFRHEGRGLGAGRLTGAALVIPTPVTPTSPAQPSSSAIRFAAGTDHGSTIITESTPNDSVASRQPVVPHIPNSPAVNTFVPAVPATETRFSGTGSDSVTRGDDAAFIEAIGESTPPGSLRLTGSSPITPSNPGPSINNDGVSESDITQILIELAAPPSGISPPSDEPHTSLAQIPSNSQLLEPDQMSPINPIQPMFTGPTDLDLLLARLDDPDFTFGGQSYDDLLLLEEILGPAAGSQASDRGTRFEDVPLGKVEVLRRRMTKDGRTKLKLALLGVVVDKCGICLSQFKEDAWACLVVCQHAFHERCLRSWMQRSATCPQCRSPIP